MLLSFPVADRDASSASIIRVSRDQRWFAIHRNTGNYGQPADLVAASRSNFLATAGRGQIVQTLTEKRSNAVSIWIRISTSL